MPQRNSVSMSMNGDALVYQGMTARSSVPLFEGDIGGSGRGYDSSGHGYGGSVVGGGSGGNLYILYESPMKTIDGSESKSDNAPTQDNTPVSRSFRKKPTRASLDRAPNQLPSLNAISPNAVLAFVQPSARGSFEGTVCVDIEAPAPSTNPNPDPVAV